MVKETSHFGEGIREALASVDKHIDDVYREVYKTSSNKHEKAVHEALLERRKSVFRRGWPDLCVVSEDELFVVEVKGRGDSLSHAQVVVLHKFAEHGIDAYVAEEQQNGEYVYVAVGNSTPWSERG